MKGWIDGGMEGERESYRYYSKLFRRDIEHGKFYSVCLIILQNPFMLKDKL